MSATLSTINVNSSDMKYFSFGNGKKIMVIIPGLSLRPVSESAEFVAAAYDIFTRNDYTVYVFDVREKLFPEFTINNLADDIAEGLNILGIKSAYIFGCSMGGMAAMTIAANHPEIVKKLVVCSSASNSEIISLSAVNEWQNLAQKGDNIALNRNMFRYIYSDEYLEKYSNAFKVLERMGTSDELERLTILINSIKSFSIADKLCEIKCPSLVIGSKKDRIIPYQEFIKIADDLGGELFLSENYSHAIYDEDSENHQRVFSFFEK